MKKLVLILTLLTLFFGIYPLAEVQAADISAGAAVWYAWWEPFWENLFANYNQSEYTNQTFEMAPAFLYGPAISIRFLKDWSFSTIFVWGNRYTAYSENDDVPGPGHNKSELAATKFDLDSTLNYNINRNIKFFAGLKYQGYTYKITENGVKQDIEITTKGIGPGAGIGLTFNLIDNIYLLFNNSLLYLKSEMDMGPDGTVKFNTYGLNTNMSFAYYIDSFDTTASLGFRYQYLKYTQTNPNDGESAYEESDKFYGFTLSVIYSF